MTSLSQPQSNPVHFKVGITFLTLDELLELGGHWMAELGFAAKCDDEALITTANGRLQAVYDECQARFAGDIR